MKRLLGMAMLAIVVAGGLSCGDTTAPSGPGTLQIRLTSPNSGADSAIVLTITGPAPLTSATAGAGLRLFSQPLGGTTTRFAMTGQLNGGATILTIGVADIGAVSQYAGTIQGVATPTYQLRPTLSGYALAVIR
ncbi:MAG: hypothetical protein WD773_06380 [Gemmatimonadales bacterium]